MTITPPILIVDDDAELRDLIAIHLGVSGYQTSEAADGRYALDLIHTGQPFSLVFLDLRMPRMNGLELLEVLRTDGLLDHLPVVVLTGDANTGRDAIRIGARTFLKKPIGVDELNNAVRTYGRWRSTDLDERQDMPQPPH